MTPEVSAAPQDVWLTLTQAERDAAYDNNAAVPGSSDWGAARNAASAAFRAAHPAGLDMAYGPGPRNAFDLYRAREAGAPCLVFIHGGYWQRNGRELFATYAAGALAHGWSVAMPSHTLAPAASLTTIVAEIGLALDWLATEGPTHGLAGPLILSGWSAGAHLAAMHLGHPRVAAGLAISGVYDLAPIRDTGLNTALALTEAEIAALSPLRLPPVPKPLAVAYGSAELPALVADARRFHARRAAAHQPGPLIPVAGADHFSILDGFLHPDGELVRAAAALLGGP